jgi:hypothetical protein
MCRLIGIGSLADAPQIREIYAYVNFLPVLHFFYFLPIAHRSDALTDLHTRWLKRRGLIQEGAIRVRKKTTKLVKEVCSPLDRP